MKNTWNTRVFKKCYLLPREKGYQKLEKSIFRYALL